MIGGETNMVGSESEPSSVTSKAIGETAEKEINGMLDTLKSNGCCDSTLLGYRKALVQFYRVTGIQSISEVDLDTITDYKLWLNRKDLKSASRQLGYVKTFLRSDRVSMHEFAARIKGIKYHRKIPTILEPDEIDRMYDHARNISGKHYKYLKFLYPCIISLLYYSGIRRAEACNLTLEDIDLKNLQITVIEGKGGKSAFVPISRQCADDIERYMKVRPDIGSNKLLISLALRPIYEGTITRIVQRIALECGIEKKGIGAHTMRRSIASHMGDNGASLFKIQRFLRHSKTETTQLYVQISPKKVREEYDEHVKPTLGTTPRRKVSKKDVINKLADLLKEGSIDEDTFKTLVHEMSSEDDSVLKMKPEEPVKKVSEREIYKGYS